MKHKIVQHCNATFVPVQTYTFIEKWNDFIKFGFNKKLLMNTKTEPNIEMFITVKKLIGSNIH